MLKKELLLCGGGKKGSHGITVGKSDNTSLTDYGYYYQSWDSNLVPNTVDGKLVQSLSNDSGDGLSLAFSDYGKGSSNSYKITRLDTNASLTLSWEFFYYRNKSGGTFFTPSDVGKTIQLNIEAV